jgi:hypothetical protein
MLSSFSAVKGMIRICGRMIGYYVGFGHSRNNVISEYAKYASITNNGKLEESVLSHPSSITADYQLAHL